MFKNYAMINATQYVVVWHKVVNIRGAKASLSRRTPARRCDEDPPDPQYVKELTMVMDATLNV